MTTPERSAEAQIDITTATPAHIDRMLADLYLQDAHARQSLESAEQNLRRHAGNYHGSSMSECINDALSHAKESGLGTDVVTRMADKYRSADEAIERIAQQAAPLNDEFDRRGGWNRAFLATSTGGHVHRSTECSTCNRNGRRTAFEWMTDYSAKEEADIVAAAGYRACTTCYPSAPLGDATSRPTSMFSSSEREKAERSADREKAKTERLAKRIANGLTSDGSEFTVTWVEQDSPGWECDPETGLRVYVLRPREKSESFMTERSAVSWYVQDKAWGNETDEKAAAYASIETAIAAKHGRDIADVRAELAKKVESKRRG